MREYIKIDVVNADSVENLLNQGWEIVETTKNTHMDGATTLNYHIGLPAKIRIDSLLSIIRQYERFGFKEKLFEAVANDFGESLDDYEPYGGFYTDSKLTGFLENYEKIVNDKRVKYYKKSDHTEYDIDDKDLPY